ncbi:MAG: hypothetical protein MHM6MM_006101 [Cercozoa sp. M6MM]
MLAAKQKNGPALMTLLRLFPRDDFVVAVVLLALRRLNPPRGLWRKVLALWTEGGNSLCSVALNQLQYSNFNFAHSIVLNSEKRSDWRFLVCADLELGQANPVFWDLLLLHLREYPRTWRGHPVDLNVETNDDNDNTNDSIDDDESNEDGVDYVGPDDPQSVLMAAAIDDTTDRVTDRTIAGPLMRPMLAAAVLTRAFHELGPDFRLVTSILPVVADLTRRELRLDLGDLASIDDVPLERVPELTLMAHAARVAKFLCDSDHHSDALDVFLSETEHWLRWEHEMLNPSDVSKVVHERPPTFSQLSRNKRREFALFRHRVIPTPVVVAAIRSSRSLREALQRQARMSEIEPSLSHRSVIELLLVAEAQKDLSLVDLARLAALHAAAQSNHAPLKSKTRVDFAQLSCRIQRFVHALDSGASVDSRASKVLYDRGHKKLRRASTQFAQFLAPMLARLPDQQETEQLLDLLAPAYPDLKSRYMTAKAARRGNLTHSPRRRQSPIPPRCAVALRNILQEFRIDRILLDKQQERVDLPDMPFDQLDRTRELFPDPRICFDESAVEKQVRKLAKLGRLVKKAKQLQNDDDFNDTLQNLHSYANNSREFAALLLNVDPAKSYDDALGLVCLLPLAVQQERDTQRWLLRRLLLDKTISNKWQLLPVHLRGRNADDFADAVALVVTCQLQRQRRQRGVPDELSWQYMPRNFARCVGALLHESVEWSDRAMVRMMRTMLLIEHDRPELQPLMLRLVTLLARVRVDRKGDSEATQLPYETLLPMLRAPFLWRRQKTSSLVAIVLAAIECGIPLETALTERRQLVSSLSLESPLRSFFASFGILFSFRKDDLSEEKNLRPDFLADLDEDVLLVDEDSYPRLKLRSHGLVANEIDNIFTARSVDEVAGRDALVAMLEQEASFPPPQWEKHIPPVHSTPSKHHRRRRLDIDLELAKIEKQLAAADLASDSPATTFEPV